MDGRTNLARREGGRNENPQDCQGTWDDPGRVKTHVDLEIWAATLLTAETQERLKQRKCFLISLTEGQTTLRRESAALRELL